MAKIDERNSFGNILKYNMSGQLIARILSWIINLYLLRVVDLSVLGFFSVRMTLYYQTVGFLSREPLRKTCLNSRVSLRDAIQYSLLSSALFFIFTVLGGVIWWFIPLPDFMFANSYGAIILVFAISALIEGIVEPVAILSLKLGDNRRYALSQSVLALLQRLIAVLLIWLNVASPLTALCLAQIFASFVYALMHLHAFFTFYLPLIFDLFDTQWQRSLLLYRYESKYLTLICTILAHSVLKQFLTSGSGYIMAFTNIFSLETQAVYDIVERIGSIVVRLVLTPLEESAAIYFAGAVVADDGGDEPSELDDGVADDPTPPTRVMFASSVSKRSAAEFAGLLRMVFILGLVVCTFGVPYSNTAVRLYGGEVLVQNEGGKFLAFYTFYLFFMALNGIIECFAFSLMDTPQIVSHGTFLLFSAILHLFLNVLLTQAIGAPGFIVANALNSALRILYNWQHIRAQFAEGRTPLQLSLAALRPNIDTIILLSMSFIVTNVSKGLFGTTGGYIHTGAHLAVGGVTFLLVLFHIYNSEKLFVNFQKKIR